MTTPPTDRFTTWGRLALYALPLAYLWWLLINQLRIPWSTNPQYAYGVAVPFLCIYLLWQSKQKAESRKQKAQIEPLPSPIFYLLLAFVALLFMPTRLVQEANPEWSLVSWALALEVIALTLLLLSRFTHHASRFTFPICFFLVAVPWPYAIENPVIQGLTRLNTGLTIEILGWLNIPALQHGNVIELRTGEVGIDEACSGIRSLQATLMLSLFFGGLYSLKASRRVLLVLAGFGLAFLFNAGRTTLLSWVAARDGIGAISQWHDPAGVTILVGCFLGLWALALWFGRRAPGAKSQEQKVAPASPPEELADLPTGKSPDSPAKVPKLGVSALRSFPLPVPRPLRFALWSLALWLVVVEIGVARWYQHIEAALPAQPTWHVVWPVAEAGFRDVPIAQKAREMLRYDEAKQAQWTAVDGAPWQLSWFYWKPGKAAGYLAKSHNPLICLPAVGYSVSAISPPQFAEISGLRLPYRIYRFEQEGNMVNMLYSRWDDRAAEQSFGTEDLTRFNRLRSVWTGRGNHGQRVIGLALWGARDAQEARDQLLRQLQQLLAIDLAS